MSYTKLFFFTLATGFFVTTLMTGQDSDPDRQVKGGGVFPSGWAVRPDNGSPSQIQFGEVEGVFHFAMGPAGTFYNPQWAKSGDYKYEARVVQTKAPSHPTSYGIMFGGSDLGGSNPTYSYFLVRGGGEYFIANREGPSRPVITNWVMSDAIAKQGPNGRQENLLGVQAQGNMVVFSINGKEVTRIEKARLHTDGLVGFRIGHNMDVEIDKVSR